MHPNSSEESDPNEQVIADKISFVLEHFPIVSPSMLQISLGSGIPTAIWHPVLEKMIELGLVYRYTKEVISPRGRNQLQTCISRNPEPTQPA